MTPPITTYAEALAYLIDRLDFEGRPHARPYTATFYSLDRFARLLERLGSPHRKAPSVHIAGTKGKGSVAVLLESGLRAAGFHTGTYTSPHLRDYPERFRLDGKPISPEGFTRSLAALAPVVEADAAQAGDMAPYRTVFELLTAVAFAVFARHRVDFAILETGLGGRLDCTNVVRPEVAIITALGLDHTALLGSTLDRIAWEKGGIIKEGIPVVVGRQSEMGRVEAMPVLRRLADERNAPLIDAEALFAATCLGWDEKGQIVELCAPSAPGLSPRPAGIPDSIRVRLPLLGDHQRDNLRTAAAAWVVLQREGWDLPWEAFGSGIEECRWPGRFEILETRPRVIIDGAHCPLSAAALGKTIDSLFPGASLHVLFGAQRDKDHRGILRALMGSDEDAGSAGAAADTPSGRRDVGSWAFHQVPGGRGAPAEDLEAAALSAGIPRDRITVHATASEALEAAVGRAGSEEIVLSFGTLYTIAEVTERARELYSLARGAGRENR